MRIVKISEAELRALDASGRFPNPHLVSAYGVIQAALYGALSDTYKHPVSVVPITSGSWKKAAVGAGAAGKPEVLEWAQANGYEGNHQDSADAWAIARAGRVLLSP